MTMWRSVVVCFGVFAAVSGFSATGPVSECVVNPGPFPLLARVVGCAAAPCALPQLEDAVINVAFRAPRDAPILTTTATVYLTVFGIPIPVLYDLGDKSVTCNYLLNTSCPVREDELLLYTLRLFIEPTFPEGLAAAIEVRILDDAGTAACLRLPFVVDRPRH